MYGRIIGYPQLKPHDLRHGVAMEVFEQHHDLEAGARVTRARADRHHTDQHQRPTAAVEARGLVLRGARDEDVGQVRMCTRSMFEEHFDVPKTRGEKR